MPDNSAVLVIDIQNDFCSDNGLFAKTGYDVSNVQKTVPNMIDFVQETRKLGLPIAFIKGVYDKKYLTQNIHERYKAKGLEKQCQSGTWGSDFYEIQPEENDVTIVKHRYDAFTNPELEKWLKENNIDTLVLTGFSSDVCVDSTARSGFMKGFYITAIKNCLASLGNKARDMEFYRNYYGAEVMDAEEFLRRYENGKRDRRI